MNRIDNLGSQADQITKVVLEDGTVAEIELIYRPTVQRWCLNVLRGTFELHGVQLVLGPNVLRSWRHVIPFGLSCVADDDVDPVYVDDFSGGRVSLYVLDQAEVAEVESTVYGTAS